MRRLIAIVALLVLCLSAWSDDLPVTYIRAGHLFNSRTGQMLSNQAILIRGERIEKVGPAADIAVPAGAKVIDLSNATVLPGLIDAHTHLLLTGEFNGRYDEQLLKESWQYRTIEATVNARLDLEAGFTAMRDLETEGAMYSDVDVRNAINRGLIPGPRLQVVTRAISTTGGYPLEGYSPEVTVPSGVQIVDSPDEARKAVREQIKYGADWIKVYGTHKFHFTPEGGLWSQPTFTLDELNAIVNEAHREGVKVACHAYGGEGLHNCIDAGVDSIEHGLDLDDAAISQMLAKGIWFCPTLYVYEFDPSEDLAMSGGKTTRARIHEVSFKKALARGVKIVFGTDAGPFPHGTQAKEFEYMTNFGMSPAAAIQSATINPATMMNWANQIGSIDPGKYADIIAVAGNPIEDIKQLEQVKFVMKGGAVVRNDFHP
ncbi:MAG: amidohydrolase family protein [Candidatus Acidiferrales bacterium]